MGRDEHFSRRTRRQGHRRPVRRRILVLTQGTVTEPAYFDRLRQLYRQVVVVVKDDGPGIPEKARVNLFRAFQGGARKGGSGLGLAIAAELVAAHGGRLEALEAEHGAAFRFDVPDRTPNV